MNHNNKKPLVTATSRTDWKGGGRDGRHGLRHDTAGTFTTAMRAGINLPNEDVGNTLTREQFLRDGR